MQKSFKKAFSVLLSLLMLLPLFGLLPLNARAAEPAEWTSSSSLPDAAGSYVLTSDIVLGATWYPVDGITVDLNGHKITSGGSYDHFVIVRNGVTFTLEDNKKDSTDPADKHYYKISNNLAVLSTTATGNYFIGGCLYGINRPSTSVGGAVYIEAGGNFVMNGGTILGHRYLVDGGGVFVRGKNEDAGLPDGVFTMNGGNIIGNHNRWGAGVYNQGIFNLNGGTIRQNYSDWGGGAVLNHGTVNMNGGTISDNGSVGVAGICVFIGTLNLNGGAIINNASSRDEGGVGGGGEKNLSGNPVVSGNTSKGSPSNLTPSGDRPITITGPLTGSEPIHITTNANVSSGSQVVLTAGWEDYMSDADFNDYFVLDNSSYQIVSNPSGEVQIVNPSLNYYSASFAPGEGSGTMADIYASNLSLPENGFEPPEGKYFAGWLSSVDGKKYAAGVSVRLSDDTIFTAQWSPPVHASFEPGTAEGDTIVNDDVLPCTVVVLPANPYTAPGDTIFSGWSDGENVYQPGYNYTLNENTVFTAQWTAAVYAYLAPGEAEGEPRTHSRVLPGTQITLPANPYTAPAGMLFNGWSDGENVYQSGYRYTLNENVSFTAQWVTGVNVTFDSNGGSAVASQLIHPNTAASQPAVPTKTGCIFKGWRLDGAFYDFSTPVTEDITLHAVWIEACAAEGAETRLYAGFTAVSGDSGVSTNENYPKLVDGSDTTKWGRRSEQGSIVFYSSEPFVPTEYLLTTANDTGSIPGRNPRNWTLEGKLNESDEWEILADVHDDDVLQNVNYTQFSFPLEGNNSAFRYFRFTYNGTWGQDFFQLSELQFRGIGVESFTHNVTFSTAQDVLTATCSNDPCAWDDHTLTLTLNAPAKTVYGDENSEFATLTDLGCFNAELGLTVSEGDIRYYQGETQLDAAPAEVGDYTAKLTVTVNGADYTIEKPYSIAKITPAPELPSGLIATYGDTLESVTLPDGWTWDDELTTSVGNAGSNVFTAKFTPEDTEHYAPVSAELTVAVAKATPTPDIPTGLTVLYGKKLADVALPAGWAWDDPADTPVGCLGDHTFSATFTPEDPDNYNTVTETLTLTVYTNYIFVPAQAPTCTLSGNTAYYRNNNRYYVVTEENELAEIELYTTVIPATGHVYGTTGNARFTCQVCGSVDQQRKADAEYEDMLPYYLSEFDACKTAVKEACDGRAMTGDSDECRALIQNAKNEIDGLQFVRGKSLEENKQAVYDVLERLNHDLAVRRGAEQTGLCPLCGGYHNGSIVGVLHAMIYVIKNFFERLFSFR